MKKTTATPEGPTPEERQKKAAALIRATVAGLRGVTGSIPCPNCGTELQYTVIAFSGRIRAACGTPECTHFEE